jgi:hypothetical protein
MKKEAWARYVNRHITPGSNLPRLSREELERWQRFSLLVPPDGEYCPTDLERTLALLMLERAILAGQKAKSR